MRSVPPAPHPARRTRRATAVTVAIVAATLVLAACGSRLAPDEVVGAQSGGSGTGGLGLVGQPGAEGPAGEVPGAAPGVGDPGVVDPGAPGDPGTAPGQPGGAPGSGGSGGSGDAPRGEGENSATGGQRAASCDGFKNQTGITDSRILLANVSDVSGPVPGIFQSAREGARAYAAYFNATAKLCGRSLEILQLDSRADAGADQQSYTRACSEAFAAVGSMSAFDSGGAAVAQNCGLPDIRSTSVTTERGRCTTCYSAQPVSPNLVGDAMPKFFLRTNRAATQSAALLFINAGAAPGNAASMRQAWIKAGWKVPYLQGIDVAEFNYAPYVQRLKDQNIRLVAYVGNYQNAVKLQQAMRQQNYKPDVFLQDGTIYDERYVQQAGDLAEGTYAYIAWELFDNQRNAEMVLYRQWLQQVAPGAIPTGFGLHAWSSARLFVEEAAKLGGRLTRAELIKSVGRVKDWTSNGLHVGQDVGGKKTTACAKIIQYRGGRWQQVSRGDYECGRLIDTGLSG